MSGAQITLITGQPGSGKTAKTVHMLRDEVAKGRVVFVLGIPGLTLPFVPMPPVKEWTIRKPIEEDPTVEQAHLNFPDGCLLVVDEAQKIFRPRGSASAVPDHVAALETHRHHGIDIWILTQHYTFIDANVRKLVKRHIHCRDHWTGWRTYERGEAFDHDSPTERAVAAIAKYKPPKDVFPLYTSSSKHVKRQRSLPKWVYFVPILPVALAYLGYHGYYATFGRQDRKAEQHQKAGGAPNGQAASPLNVGAHPPAQGAMLEARLFEPRITTRPESAPLYDGIRQVRALPFVAGCAATPKRCTCYTPQGTDAFLNDGQCREWLRSPPFNPWSEPPPPVQIKTASAQAVPAAASDVLISSPAPAPVSDPAPQESRLPRVPQSSPWRAP